MISPNSLRNLILTVLIPVLVNGCMSQKTGITSYHQQILDIHDDDLDGVINERDHCLNTPVGASVNNVGCPQWETVLNQYAQTIFFSRDSSSLSNPKAQKVLQEIASVVIDNPQSTIILTGYSSQPASDDYNLKLSQRRAEHVQQQLIQNFGLSTDQIKVRWKGEQNPIKSGNTPQANQANRRVTALVINEQNRPIKKWSAQTFPQPVFQ